MENKTAFQVICGGKAETALTSRKEFISAYITDTRLMGVVGVYIHWSLPDNSVMKHFHQFFYLDAEELGFDTYESVTSEDDLKDEDEKYFELKSIENRLMGGLGGSKVQVSEKEVRHLIQEYVRLNLRAGIDLPGNFKEYEFILSPMVQMTDEEEFVLTCKQCAPISTPYQVINYFLMRCFGRDFTAAKFLTKNYVRTDIFPEHKGATLLINTIDEASDAYSGSNTNYRSTGDDRDFGTFRTQSAYLCQSLIEYDAKYYLIVTQVTLEELKVAKYERISSFRVSAAEASMMTSRPEYITVFDYMGEGSEIDNDATKLSAAGMVTEHESGRVIIIFYPNNSHVGKKQYRLNDDVMGVYYILDEGQIVVSAYDEDNIKMMETDILESRYRKLLFPIAKYKFKEPVLFEFVNSDFDDFEEFVSFINDEEDD